MKRLFLMAVVVLQLASGAPAARAVTPASPAELDLPGYIAELGRWSASATRLREHPDEAASLRKKLPAHWAVAFGGQHVQVSTDWLGAGLDHLAANPKLAASTSHDLYDRLQSMLQDSRDLAQFSEPGSTQARARLDDILKRREFRSLHAANAKDALWNRLMEGLEKLVDWLFNRAGSHPVATKVLLWGVVFVLGLAFLAWLIYSLASVPFSKLSSRRTQMPEALVEPAGTWREWALQARAAAARGEYRDAVRIIYGAAVRRIAEAGAWQVDPARTHREYVRLLPSDALQRPQLVAITSCFERVWYGNMPASVVDYEAVLAQLESLP